MQPAAPMPDMQRRANAMLLLATFFWGWTFPVVKDAIAVMPVFAFLTFRFALAAAGMACISGIPRRSALKKAAPLGIVLFLSFALQTVGLLYTSASNAAFITGLNIVWVALAGARDARTWASVALGVGGLWLLAAPDAESGLNRGDILSLVCSLFFALHIIMLSKLEKHIASGEMALIQFAIVAVLSLFASLIFEAHLLPDKWTLSLVFALAITVLGATIFSFWVQTHYQRHTTATHTALIFIMEPVFAAAFAVLFYDEQLPLTAAAGAGLVFAAMLLAIVRRKRPPMHS